MFFPRTFIFFLLSVLVIAPRVAHAQTLQLFIDRIATLIGSLTPVAAGLALLFFFWGLAKFILAAGSEDKREEGKKVMIWGTIALFVLFSILGIVRLFQNEFKVDNNTPLAPPCLAGEIFGGKCGKE